MQAFTVCAVLCAAGYWPAPTQSVSAKAPPKPGVPCDNQPTPFRKDPIFILLGLTTFLGTLGFFSPFVHLANYANELGCSEHVSGFAYTLYGVLSIVGRLMAGPLGDRFGALRIWACGIAGVGASFLLLSLGPTCSFVPMGMASMGVMSGPVIALFAPLMVQLFGLERLPMALGTVLMYNGLAGFCSPAFAGFIRDVSGSYRYSWAASSGEAFMASVICLVINYMHMLKTRGK